MRLGLRETSKRADEMQEGRKRDRQGTARQSAKLSDTKICITRACSGPHRDEGSVTPESLHLYTHRAIDAITIVRRYVSEQPEGEDAFCFSVVFI